MSRCYHETGADTGILVGHASDYDGLPGGTANCRQRDNVRSAMRSLALDEELEKKVFGDGLASDFAPGGECSGG